MKPELASISGNRLEFGDWFIVIHPYSKEDIVVQVRHKTRGDKFSFDSIEEAANHIKYK